VVLLKMMKRLAKGGMGASHTRSLVFNRRHNRTNQTVNCIFFSRQLTIDVLARR